MADKLGQIMLQQGAITEKQLDEAIQAQVVFGGRLGTNLVDLGYTDVKRLGDCLSKMHGVPTVNAMGFKPSSHNLLKAVGKKLASKHHCVPIAIDKTSISLLMADPFDQAAIEEIGFTTGRRVKPHVAPELVILSLLETFYAIPRPMRYISFGKGHVRVASDDVSKDPQIGEKEVRPVEKEEMKDVDFNKYFSDHAKAGNDYISDLENIELRGDDEGEIEEIMDLDGLIHEEPVYYMTEITPLEDDEEDLELIEELPEILTLQEATARLMEVEDRDELSRIVLSFAHSYFKRSALFITRFGRVIGWYGMGEGLSAEMVKSIMIPLDEPCVFKTVFDSQAFYLGGIPSTPFNDLFLKAMGNEKPQSAFLIPVHFKGQVVNILYGDNGEGQPAPFDISELLILAPKIPQAFEQLIRKKKSGG